VYGTVRIYTRITLTHFCPYGLRGCKNRACSVAWLEVKKGIPNQGVDYFVLARAGFVFVMFRVYALYCLFAFGCQYLCNQLPGKTHLRNDLLCVEWGAKPYSLTHSLLTDLCIWKAEIWWFSSCELKSASLTITDNLLMVYGDNLGLSGLLWRHRW